MSGGAEAAFEINPLDGLHFECWRTELTGRGDSHEDPDVGVGDALGWLEIRVAWWRGSAGMYVRC